MFYVPGITPGMAVQELPPDVARHCLQVLRMQRGEALQLTDGIGHIYDATIAEAGKRNAAVALHGYTTAHQPTKKLSIGISLLKNQARLEWFFEKATEIGVQEIIPLICHRTERQHFRYDRMQGILSAAMIQSRQAWLPVLQQPTDLDTVVSSSAHLCRLIAHCGAGDKTPIADWAQENDLQVLIGPEGDFSPDEIQLATDTGFQAVSLGNNRLRTETAGMVAVTLLRLAH